jgi:hypothetical protein
MVAAAVVVVALGLGLLGAALWTGYSKWSGGSNQQATNTVATTPATDAAQGGIPAGVAPPEGQAVPQPVATPGATTAETPGAATTPPTAAAEPPAAQYQAPAAQTPASVQARTPAATPPSAPVSQQTAPPPSAPVSQQAAPPPPTPVSQQAAPPPPTPVSQPAAPPPSTLKAVPVARTPAAPPSGGTTLPATVVPGAPAATARPATKPEPPPPAPPAAKPPAVESAPAGDAIPDAGSFGWRSKPLTASGEWKTGFQRGIIKNYEDMYSGSPALWAAIAPGVKLSQFKIVVGRVQNLSGLDRPQIQAAFPGGLQTAIDGEVGTKGTVTVNAQLAVIAAADDDKQGRSMVVEMIFRDTQGKILAKLHHRTEGRDFDGTVEDMVAELTDFVVDHPVVSVKKVK